MTTPDGPFWELVKAELRATWCGRWRYVWWFLAGATLSSSAALHPPLSIQSSFTSFCILASWLPAWLASDLFSTQVPDNPEPHRVWPLPAFASRAVGRIGPLLAAQSLWVAAFAVRANLAPYPGPNAYPQGIMVSYGLLGAVQWVLFFLTASIAVAGMAAALSLAFRRPQRLLVALATVILLAAPAAVVWTRVTGQPVPQQMWTLPASAVGAIALRVLDHSPMGTPAYYRGVCLWFSMSHFLIAVPLLATCYWVTTRRNRRHPYTARTNPKTVAS